MRTKVAMAGEDLTGVKCTFDRFVTIERLTICKDPLALPALAYLRTTQERERCSVHV
jgi:hypothetical protein